MPDHPKTLVTSAGGKASMTITFQLMAQHYPICIFVRQSDKRSAQLASARAETLIGDQYSIGDMRKVMKGVTSIHAREVRPARLYWILTKKTMEGWEAITRSYFKVLT